MSVPQAETPMMRQFNAIKREHPDKLLFYRMGDFYEMYVTKKRKTHYPCAVCRTRRTSSI